MKIYNTITQKIEEFIPQDKNNVKMYVCGITPYDDVHLGHGRCYVVFDVIRRYLEYKGYNISFIQNFTDIDDKIISRAKELNISPAELTEKYISSYFESEKLLNIKRAILYPKVTQHIEDIISVIEKLIKKGYAYITPTGVYFSISQFRNYGILSKHNLEDLISGARVEPDETKKSPLDFALWKLLPSSSISHPSSHISSQSINNNSQFAIGTSWSSPWGVGRPGWHIECSVMSIKYLGETLDIHGGGQDLIFPHHENELAQSEAVTEKTFVKYWLHNGFVTINKEKMSKSLKNIFSLNDLFKEFDPMVVRLFLISQHYRGPLDFSIEEMKQFQPVYQKFVNTKEDLIFMLDHSSDTNVIEEKIVSEVNKIITEFESAMEDDFNTSVALGAVHKLINLLNTMKSKNKNTLKFVYDKFLSLMNVLGLRLPDKIEIPQEIETLKQQRELARKNKDFNTADKLRKEIFEKGFVLEDTPFGPRIKKKI